MISPDTELKFLDPLVADPAWTQVALLLRLGLVLLLVVLFFRLARRSGPAPKSKSFRVPAGFSLLAFVGFALIAVRQASWQVLGRRNDAFVEFMQRYDRREFNPAHRVRAGKLLDRRGRVLAVSRVTERGVRRFYPFGPVFSHVVGYNDPVYGLTGIEAVARRRLLGKDMPVSDDWKSLGAELLDRETYAEGPAVRTTLDLDLQHLAHRLLGDRQGAVVVLEVGTGDVLALVSKPDFDPNRLYPRLFTEAPSRAPLLNRALSGQYPPGSVFKVLTAAAALREGFAGTFDTPAEGFTTSPSTPPIRDHEYYTAREKGRKWRGRGRIGLSEALVHSSNVFFAQLGAEVGAEALERTARAAGLTHSVALWDDADSLRLPAANLSDLDRGHPYALAQFSIGQGQVLVSPMHIAMICQAVANEGLSLAPRLTEDTERRVLGRVSTPEEAETLKWMMYKVVQEGTGRGIRIPELAVAGKTGTAQTGSGPSHSWFAGFAPVSKPQVAFCVLVEEGGYGSAAALPIARDLLQTSVRKGWLRP